MEPSGAFWMSSSMPSKSRPTVSGSKYRYFSTCKWLNLAAHCTQTACPQSPGPPAPGQSTGTSPHANGERGCMLFSSLPYNQEVRHWCTNGFWLRLGDM